jgi:hypothetical protein
MTEHAVVIVGAGPTGLMLAGELALARVDVAIVERRAGQDLAGSRAGGLHSRTIEVLDQRGIADRFLSQGQIAQVAGFASRWIYNRESRRSDCNKLLGQALKAPRHRSRFPYKARGATLVVSTAEADAMKISGIRSSIVALPADEPLADAAENPNATRPIVTLQIETDEGVVGVGVTYFGGALTGALRSAVDELGALMVGEDPLRVEAVAAFSTWPTPRSTRLCGTSAARR